MWAFAERYGMRPWEVEEMPYHWLAEFRELLRREAREAKR